MAFVSTSTSKLGLATFPNNVLSLLFFLPPFLFPFLLVTCSSSTIPNPPTGLSASDVTATSIRHRWNSDTSTIPKPPTGLSASDVTATSILLRWDPDTSSLDPASSYDIQLIERGRNSDPVFEEEINITRTSHTVGYLKPNTNYTFYVVALNSKGRSMPSLPIQVTTAEIESPPENVVGYVDDVTTIAVSWDEPKIPNGDLQGYKVFYSARPEEPIFFWHHQEVEKDIRMAIITGLIPNVTYTISVLAYSSTSQGPMSHPIQVATNKGVRRIAPKFTRTPEDVKIMPDSDVNLTCVAVGSPMPFVKWREGAQNLTGNGNLRMGRNTLILTSILMSKNYTCEASSGRDIIQHHVQVIVQAPGSSPENVTAQVVDATTVIVTWDKPKFSNGDIQGYKLFYTTSPEEPIFFWDEHEVINDNRMATLTGLTPNETYAITILAYSSTGQGPMCHPIQVFINNEVPGRPRNVNVEAINSSAISVQWDPPEGKEQNALIIGYKVYYTGVNSTLGPWSGTREQIYDSHDPTKTNVVITGLKANTLYFVEVAAYTWRGIYWRSAHRSTTTKIAEHHDDAVQKFRVTQRLTNQVQLSWDKPKRDDVQSYMLRYEGVKTYREDHELKHVFHEPKEVKINHQHTTWTVTNLKPKMKLEFRISAIFRDGEESPLRTLVTETLFDAPPHVEKPTVLAVQNRTVKLKLKRASQINGPISHYHIVVVPAMFDMTKLPSDYTLEELTKERMSTDTPASHPYIAASFESLSLQPHFYLGNNQEYGSFSNRPLQTDDRYRVFLRAFSGDQHLYTSSDFSDEISISSSISSPRPSISSSISSPRPSISSSISSPRPSPGGEKKILSGNTEAQTFEGDGQVNDFNDVDASALLTIVAPTCAGVVIVIIICAIICFKIMRKKNKIKGDPMEPEANALIVEPPPSSVDPVDMM